MSDVAIRAKHLSKRYRIGEREPYKALRDTLTNAAYAPFRRLSSVLAHMSSGEAPSQTTDDQYHWALKDVSLEVRQGEALGIIGPNGAGKTTLLKVLSRITEPTEGYAEIYGRVASLLEVGTGFHPELTGRENIYLNGAILGMGRAEIGQKFDEIVDFSGVEKFIDTPVKRYSSGMSVRLAFAIAAHLDPEIFLVDEVLAVGDAAFQEKCLGKMSEVAGGGRTVLFVSHNMGAIRNLCSRALLLNGGEVQSIGTTEDAIRAYLADAHSSQRTDHITLAERRDRSGSGNVRLVSFQARMSGTEDGTPQTGSDAELVVDYTASAKEILKRLNVSVGVVDTYGVAVFSCTTAMTSMHGFRNIPPSGRIVCRIRNLPLIPGNYWVNLLLKDHYGVADLVDNAARFNVIDGGGSGFTEILSRKHGNVIVQHEWECLPPTLEEDSGR